MPDTCPESRLASELYLDLMKRTVTNAIYDPNPVDRSVGPPEKWWGWPEVAHSMLGRKRLDNLQYCVEDTIEHGVPGDLIETGVWRGGATIFMRAILKVHDVRDRTVWVADSFEGLPPPNPAYPADEAIPFHTFSELAIPLEAVKRNFERYGLLDDQVRFLRGFFSQTLPTCPVERLAVLRLDGDMYESTMDALVHLYPKLSTGGYVIVDDYGAVPACKLATHDFRDRHGITTPMTEVDWTAVYWQKTAG
jgi:Macrocin-O-methyltransferase (TylF)